VADPYPIPQIDPLPAPVQARRLFYLGLLMEVWAASRLFLLLLVLALLAILVSYTHPYSCTVPWPQEGPLEHQPPPAACEEYGIYQLRR
jgi:hypothetical protein